LVRMIKMSGVSNAAGQTRGVDLITQMRLDGPFPTRAGSGSSARPGLPCGPPARSTQRVWRWPGWHKCRPPGLRWRPSPSWGTPVVDETVAAGCLRDWLWSVAPAKG
jgi:hypothetical protein